MHQSERGQRSGRGGYQPADRYRQGPYEQLGRGQAEGDWPRDQPGRYQHPDVRERRQPDAYRQPDPYQRPALGAYEGFYRQPPQQGYAPGAHEPAGYAPAAVPSRKKRRIFMWFFFVVQALFLIWLITGLATGHSSNATDLAQVCGGHNWFPIFKSHADCMTHYNNALNDAQDVGKGIGVALIVVIWIVVDFFLGLGYGIYRLATRSR